MLKTLAEAASLNCPYTRGPCGNGGCMAWNGMAHDTGFCVLLSNIGETPADRMAKNIAREIDKYSLDNHDVENERLKYVSIKILGNRDQQNIRIKDQDAMTLCEMMRDAISFQISKKDSGYDQLKERTKIIDRYSFVKAAVMGQFVSREVKFRSDEEQDITCGFDKGL